MNNFEEKYEHSNPLFPLVSFYVYQQEWEKLKSQGAKIVPETEIDASTFFEGDGDYTSVIPVIEYEGKKYDRFISLIKAIYPEDQVQELIQNWNNQLSSR